MVLEPFISSIDSGRLLGHCFIEAIRSVTHLVLAPFPKKLSLFLLLKASSSLSFLQLNRAPDPLLRVQKTFSAGPCSFSCGELWFRWLAPASNPFVTHGPVESPAKCFSAVHCMIERSATASNQSGGLFTNPFTWLTAALLNSSSHF